MSDQIVTNAQQPEVTQPQTATAPATTGEEVFTKAQVEQMFKDRLTREKEAEAKRVATAAQKAAAEAAAQQGEWQKLAEQREKEAGELKAQLAALELTAKKHTIGAKYGLPAEIAELLKGSTDEELDAHAQKLKALMAPVQKPSPGPVNPGAGGQVAETREQVRARLLGGGVDLNDPATVKRLGGGVFFTE